MKQLYNKLLAQLFTLTTGIVLGVVLVNPYLQSFYAPQQEKDVLGYEQVLANIDSGEVYYGK